MQQTVSRVMTITHSEFLRSLGPLERHYRIMMDDRQRRILITDDSDSARSGEVQIHLGPQNTRKLANLRLPTIEVELVFKDLTIWKLSCSKIALICVFAVGVDD